MNYIVATQEWMAAHGLLPLPSMRKSKDGSKIILHEDYFNALAGRDGEGNPLPGGADVYAHNSPALQALLQSEEWQAPDEAAEAPSPGYVQAAAAHNLYAAVKAGIQALDLADNEALEVKEMYPAWEELAGQALPAGFRLQYGEDLYKVVQAHTAQEVWKPDALPALYALVQDSHAGTLQDPIPYERMMLLEEGKYYAQGGKTYLCVTGSVVGYDADLADLAALVQEVQTGEGRP